VVAAPVACPDDLGEPVDPALLTISLQTDAPSVADVIHRAAALCDPDSHDEVVSALVERFEDDDRPARGVEGLAGELQTAAREADPEGDSPAGGMVASAAAWLSTNFDQADARERVLREAARAAFGGEPPDDVASWLEAEGVSL
jgi:hypothetical protein